MCVWYHMSISQIRLTCHTTTTTSTTTTTTITTTTTTTATTNTTTILRPFVYVMVVRNVEGVLMSACLTVELVQE